MTGLEPRSVKLLVSVRNAAEADIAVNCGADIIDAKEPCRGSLGPVDAQILTEIIQKVAGRKPISAAGGELLDHPPITLPTGFEYIKIGLANAQQRNSWPDMLEKRFQTYGLARPVAAAYADYQRAGSPPVTEVFDWAQHHRAAGFLIDTAVKDGAGLFDWLTSRELSTLITAARKADILVALAGSLAGESLEKALQLEPDIVAVRGAACPDGAREKTIECSCVRALATRVSDHNKRVGARAN
ncbi:MAG: hypothetical protein IT444_10415 [Phycisphaeraceae bacterium]|nr:hypothetical protein [Phycisphaeraceae bacterium]